MKSLPSRERGLKSVDQTSGKPMDDVAPFAGAWIEMSLAVRSRFLPPVAPFAGAWIEIDLDHALKKYPAGRSLRGSVD